MKKARPIMLAALLGLSASVATAQPGGGPGMGPGAGAMRWGADVTPGWALMTEQERREHQERMRTMTTYEACKAYQAQHHEQMAARAKERGAGPLPQPRRDPCIGLKK